MSQPVLLDGDSLARSLRAGLRSRAARLRDRGIRPCLATILVGDDPASTAYVGRKHADCREVGIETRGLRLPAEIDAPALRRYLDALNTDPGVHGVLVQMPLPPHLDDAEFLARVDPARDVDGLHPENIGRLQQGAPRILPCTPAGILALLRHHAVPLEGAEIVIIGRGGLVGRPLALLLSARGIDATVTLAHSRSRDLARITARADVVVSATGVPGLVRAEMLRPGAAVVGVGIARSAAGEVQSDIADDVGAVAGWVTPRHGSVGALTRAMLLENLLALAAGQGKAP